MKISLSLRDIIIHDGAKISQNNQKIKDESFTFSHNSGEGHTEIYGSSWGYEPGNSINIQPAKTEDIVYVFYAQAGVGVIDSYILGYLNSAKINLSNSEQLSFDELDPKHHNFKPSSLELEVTLIPDEDFDEAKSMCKCFPIYHNYNNRVFGILNKYN